jgi:hypothetical protein
VNYSRYRKLAGEAYDRIADRPGRFEMDEVRREIRIELNATGADSELLDEFADSLAQQVDDRRTSKADSAQYDLLTGEPAAFDAVWRLGGGRRVRVRYANREDALARLALQKENRDRVDAAYEAERKRLSLLMPYLTDPDVTMPDTVTRYREDRRRKGKAA